MHACIPILRMFDEKHAREFYLDYLGFKIRFEHRFSDDAPLYIGIYRGDCEIHLSEHHGDGSPGARIRIGVDDIEKFHGNLDPAYKFARPDIHTQPWGMREVMIADPFGNTIVFCQDSI
ncbi:MAG: VOC family protein [Rhodobacteraceae bacterium]|nr:VOC family protein [Paracoccaceae bacterium]